MIKRGIKENLVFKRKLRSAMTPAENELWYGLKYKQFNGCKFRRQHGIGSYIVDFYCPKLKLVIEIDGDIHVLDHNVKRDERRELYLKKLGLKIVRYTNNDVIKNIDGVMKDLYDRLNEISTFPNPSLQRRGK